MDKNKNILLQYVLQLADNAMILGQRLGELCGHGPILEQDIAITNISLDLIGEARVLYSYAAEIEGNGKTEDDYPYKRDILDWKNILLVEQPNGHFGHTIVRQFMFDCYHYYHLTEMRNSSDIRLAEIAKKTIKEATYHLKYSSEWMIRLGDGTEESHAKMQEALSDLIRFFDEAFIPSKIEKEESLKGIAVDCERIRNRAWEKFRSVCEEATLKIPEVEYPQEGGKNGLHSEQLGFILADLQFLQRAYPNSNW
ncbi:MAG: phenylacetate-CoA oxygenase subunit PaaC [Saprospiraceae bacterium]|nr:phenylacetate-CoA oxygenase subunit PaaC [Saprospiraceae bacterium]